MAVQFMGLIGKQVVKSSPCIGHQGYNYRVPNLIEARTVGSWRLLYSNDGESRIKGERVGRITAVHQQIGPHTSRESDIYRTQVEK